jgi:hypothetical protein
LGVIEEYSAQKPVLVFCATRKSAVSSAESIIGQISQKVTERKFGHSHPFVKTREQFDGLNNLKGKISDRKLAGTIGLKVIIRMRFGRSVISPCGFKSIRQKPDCKCLLKWSSKCHMYNFYSSSWDKSASTFGYYQVNSSLGEWRNKRLF